MFVREVLPVAGTDGLLHGAVTEHKGREGDANEMRLQGPRRERDHQSFGASLPAALVEFGGQKGYLQEYRIHRTLADVMVRSKSEVIIANMLFDREIPFEYEKPLYAKDGSFYLPDFTIQWRGRHILLGT